MAPLGEVAATPMTVLADFVVGLLGEIAAIRSSFEEYKAIHATMLHYWDTSFSNVY